MSAALVRVAQEGLSKGLSLGDSFKRETVFPASVTSLITISEQSGSLDEVLATLSTFYDSEIESAIKTMVAFIEPALLVLIGFVVALIALSIIVPVYQLVGQF
jgi:type IV pilus assembly protein PilC